MKIKTAEATGPALDWLVAKCLGTLGEKPRRCFDCKYFEERSGRDDAIYYCHHPKSEWGGSDDGYFGDGISPNHGVHHRCPITDLTPEPYSTDWSQGGPIIERERIRLDCAWSDEWTAQHPYNAKIDVYTGWTKGPTALIAAMRCYVTSKLGDEVEIPEELA